MGNENLPTYALNVGEGDLGPVVRAVNDGKWHLGKGDLQAAVCMLTLLEDDTAANEDRRYPSNNSFAQVAELGQQTGCRRVIDDCRHRIQRDGNDLAQFRRSQ